MASETLSLEGSSENAFLIDSYRETIELQEDSSCPSPADLEQLIASPLAHRIQLLKTDPTGRYATYEIDRCLRAQVLADGFRTQMAEHWRSDRIAKSSKAWICAASSVLSASLIPTAATVIALAALPLSAYGAYWYFSQASIASEQAERWATLSTTQEIAERRANAYKYGFLHAHQNNAVRETLRPCEVLYLFEKYFPEACRNLLSQNPSTCRSQKTWLDECETLTSLALEVFSCVYGQVPGFYMNLSARFEKISPSLKEIHREFNLIKDARQKETADRLLKIKSQRKLLLSAPFQIRETTIRQAKETLKQAKRKDIEQAKKTFTQAVKQADLLYQSAAAPINAYFNQKAYEANKNLFDVLTAIFEDENLACSKYYHYARSLIEAAPYAKELPSELDFSFPTIPPLTPMDLEYRGQ